MSKIKPDTYLPLFGVETEYPPKVTYYLSGLFPLHMYDDLAVDSGLGRVYLSRTGELDDRLGASVGLRHVTLIDPPDPNKYAYSNDALSVGVALRAVLLRDSRAWSNDAVAVSVGLRGVRFSSANAFDNEALAVGVGLRGVTIS